MFFREPLSELRWWCGSFLSTNTRNFCSGTGTIVAMRSANGVSSSARSVPSPVVQSPAM